MNGTRQPNQISNLLVEDHDVDARNLERQLRYIYSEELRLQRAISVEPAHHRIHSLKPDLLKGGARLWMKSKRRHQICAGFPCQFPVTLVCLGRATVLR